MPQDSEEVPKGHHLVVLRTEVFLDLGALLGSATEDSIIHLDEAEEGVVDQVREVDGEVAEGLLMGEVPLEGAEEVLQTLEVVEALEVVGEVLGALQVAFKE